jgi:hypothetical protein
LAGVHLEHNFAETDMSAECCETGSLARSRDGGAERAHAGERAVRLRRLVCLLALTAGLTACQEVEYTPEQSNCIASHYAAYDSKQINQCVDVCRVCMKGNVVTCNTSCRLRGAH